MSPRLFLLLLPLGLASCAETPAQSDADWRKYLPKDYRAQRTAVTPRVAGAVPSVSPGTIPSPTEIPPAIPMPARLVGLSDAELRTQLGTPSEEREAGAARVWTWRGRDCAVEAWLYYDTARAGFYALDQQISGRATSIDSCLRGGAKGA